MVVLIFARQWIWALNVILREDRDKLRVFLDLLNDRVVMVGMYFAPSGYKLLLQNWIISKRNVVPDDELGEVDEWYFLAGISHQAVLHRMKYIWIYRRLGWDILLWDIYGVGVTSSYLPEMGVEFQLFDRPCYAIPKLSHCEWNTCERCLCLNSGFCVVSHRNCGWILPVVFSSCITHFGTEFRRCNRSWI